MEKKKTVQGKKLELESWKSWSEEEGGRGDLRFLYSFDTLFDSFSFYEASNSRHYLDCFVPCPPSSDKEGWAAAEEITFRLNLLLEKVFTITILEIGSCYTVPIGRFDSKVGKGSWYNSKIGHPWKKSLTDNEAYLKDYLT